MRLALTPVLALGLLAVAPRAGDPKVKDSVRYARNWDAAVAEAQLLNLPLIVHSHGFY